jgi:hypothetical protein
MSNVFSAGLTFCAAGDKYWQAHRRKDWGRNRKFPRCPLWIFRPTTSMVISKTDPLRIGRHGYDEVPAHEWTSNDSAPSGGTRRTNRRAPDLPHCRSRRGS